MVVGSLWQSRTPSREYTLGSSSQAGHVFTPRVAARARLAPPRAPQIEEPPLYDDIVNALPPEPFHIWLGGSVLSHSSRRHVLHGMGGLGMAEFVQRVRLDAGPKFILELRARSFVWLRTVLS
jgi:hypothetical protein